MGQWAKKILKHHLMKKIDFKDTEKVLEGEEKLKS